MKVNSRLELLLLVISQPAKDGRFRFHFVRWFMSRADAGRCAFFATKRSSASASSRLLIAAFKGIQRKQHCFRIEKHCFQFEKQEGEVRAEWPRHIAPSIPVKILHVVMYCIEHKDIKRKGILKRYPLTK